MLVFTGCDTEPDTDETRMDTTATVGTPDAAATGQRTAVATLGPASNSGVTGTATFTEENGTVTLVLEVQNVKTPGKHAVHIHEFGDCSAPDASSAGGHWNPTNEAHGHWGNDPFHKGDIGNIEIGEDGTGRLTMSTDLWSIGGDSTSNILGRSVIVHEGVDDFTSQPSGNAGGRIACGVIQQ